MAVFKIDMSQEIPKKELNALKKSGLMLNPILRIGKNGVNDNVIGEIEKVIKKRKLIKVKTLRAFSDVCDVDEAILKITEKTGCTLVSKTGFNFVLYKNASSDIKKEASKITSKKPDFSDSKVNPRQGNIKTFKDYQNNPSRGKKPYRSTKSKNFGQYNKNRR